MKKLKFLLIILAISCLVKPALAGCPDIDGIFSYTENAIIGGHVTDASINTMEIQCVIPTETSSWSTIKAQYR